MKASAPPRGRLPGLLLDAAYLLAAPALFLALLVPSRVFTRRRYGAGLRQKLLGPPARAGGAPCLWIHAVSVGEVRAAIPLVAAVRSALPGWDIRVSTSTDTGQEVARGAFAPGETCFAPIDLGFSVRRAFARIRPSAVVLIELELWPNFLLAARALGVPVLVANGRISPRSFPRYRRLGALARLLFRGVTAAAAQNEEYAGRFEALGVPRDRIAVLGNLKYDGAAPPAGGEPIRGKLGWPEGSCPVLAAGCTHPGEEEMLLDAWMELRRPFPELRLVLAPRHIERAAEVEALVSARAGVAPLRWKAVRGLPAAPASPVLVVDTIGELDGFYRIADVAFVGGSLVPRGGHNLLEPARHGKPVLFGPSTGNFEDIAAHLLAASAAIRVADAADLRGRAAALLSDPAGRAALGARARAAAEALRGATARHAAWIAERVSGLASAPR